jgi:AraC-like DNA-binding protein
MLIEPGEVHTTTKLLGGSASFSVAFIQPAEIERAAEELGGRRSTVHLATANVEDDPVLSHTLAALHGSLGAPATPLERQSLLASSVRQILGRYAETAPSMGISRREPAAVRRVREYLHEHYTEAVSLDRCAVVAALSRFHLLRAFAAGTGLPPHTYQLGLRIARARRLLAAGLPPALVASELGFADQSHFTRCFRQTVGVTPGVYARALS